MCRIDALIVALAGVLFAAGPLGVARPVNGPFANLDIVLNPTRAFDAPWPDAPAFYSQLGAEEDALVVEFPALRWRRQQLYRSYFLQHQKPVWLATLEWPFGALPEEGYLHVMDFPSLSDAVSSNLFLVVHLDIRQETMEYWRFVRSTAGSSRSKSPFLLQHEEPYPNREAMMAIVGSLDGRLGPPFFEDRRIKVYRAGTKNRR